ncbi:VPLPA-CTERM sorting domain-containing protein [Pseudodesulfovibrio portus]|nr:VPLPA-CTERM sorting domain-containing protein [Pseudodesulfovibrio portus]
MLGATASFASAVLPGSYGTATHSTPKWQELATATSQTGVFWSVDGGATWTQDTDLKLGLGDTIQFQFNMYKRNYGTHYADFLKAWADWGQGGPFDSGDVVGFWKQELEGYGTNAPSGDTYTFYSDEYTMTDAMFGDLFLRARVTCSESLLNNWNAQWSTPDATYDLAFLPTGNLYQGEVEEWHLTISKTPLPPSVLMFGTGLIGMLAVTRRRFLKF